MNRRVIFVDRQCDDVTVTVATGNTSTVTDATSDADEQPISAHHLSSPSPIDSSAEHNECLVEKQRTVTDCRGLETTHGHLPLRLSTAVTDQRRRQLPVDNRKQIAGHVVVVSPMEDSSSLLSGDGNQSSMATLGNRPYSVPLVRWTDTVGSTRE